MSEYCSFNWGVHFNPLLLPVSSRSGETDKKKLIHNLRSLALSKSDIVNPRTEDEFLERFLTARKNNFEETCDLYCNYYSFRKRNPDVFSRLNGQDVLIQQALRDGFPGVLERRDKKEFLIAEESNQHHGFVFVIDWTGFPFKQSSNLTPRILKLMIEGLQDCFPAKFKGIHFINQPWYVEVALTAIKPFLKEKSKDRIYLHGNNLSTLHEYVAKDILPTELGGEGPPFNPLPWAEKLMTQSLE